MFRNIPVQAIFVGLLAGFVGYSSSFAVVLGGLVAAGASAAQSASGLLAVAVGCGACALLLSLYTRLPVSVAWSTPGAALLAATGAVEGGFAGAVGAFLLAALGFVLAGMWKPLGRAVAAIPSHLASAMLAGVLLSLCLAPFKAVAADPSSGLPILLAWLIVGQFNRLWAVPAALCAFGCVVAFVLPQPANGFGSILSSIKPSIELVAPTFNLSAALSVAVPLFLVTMASQNIAGIAVMRSYGYETKPGPWIATTGLFSLLAAPFGGHAINLAAITAAMCAGEDAHPDRDQRFWAAVFMGVAMIGFGLASGLVIAFVSLAPPILIEAVAGLALFSAFSAAIFAAFEDPKTREASAITFLFAASGITVLGIGGAFWGLLAGALINIAKRKLQSRA
jgi:benzoate membrane transport protein